MHLTTPLAVKEARSLSRLTIQQQDMQDFIDTSHDLQDHPHRQTNPVGGKAGSPTTGDGGFVYIRHKLARQHSVTSLCRNDELHLWRVPGGGAAGRRFRNDAAKKKKDARPRFPETARPCITLLHAAQEVYFFLSSPPQSKKKKKRQGPASVYRNAFPSEIPNTRQTNNNPPSHTRHISYSFTFAWLRWMLPTCAMLMNSCSGRIRPLRPPFEREPTLIWMTHLQCKTRSISNPAWRAHASHSLT